MQLVDSERAPVTSRWSSRVALFALGLVISAVFMHRLLGMSTPVAANLFAVALGCAILSIALAAIASIRIWRRGAPGTARVMFSVTLSLAILLIPVLLAVAAAPYPTINDVSTDLSAPPEFVTLAKARPPGSNSAVYPGEAFAAKQARAYPDLRPIMISRSSEEAFELVVDAVKRMKMQIVRQDPPGSTPAAPGSIEAMDRTLIMGFYDDVAIRVTGDDTSARVDMRSASRFGRSDLGRNAERLHLLAQEIHMRIDATVPAAGEEGMKRKRGGEPKRPKEGDQKQVPPRRSQDRAQ